MSFIKCLSSPWATSQSNGYHVLKIRRVNELLDLIYPQKKPSGVEGTHTYSAFSVPAFVRDVVNPKTEKTRSGYEVQRKQ